MLLEQPCGTLLSLPPHRVANQSAAFLSEWLVTVSPSTSSGAITDPRETEWHSVRACHIKWSKNYYQLIELLVVQKWFQTLLGGQLWAATQAFSGFQAWGGGLMTRNICGREKETGALTPLDPRVLRHEWWCWDSQSDISVPIYLKKKIYIYIYIFGDNSVLKDLGVNWKVWDELNLVFLDQRNSPLNAF